MIRALAFIALAAAFGARAQEAAKGFPSDSTVPSAKEIHERLADRKFLVRPLDGNELRLAFTADGRIDIDAKSGNSYTGDWRTEDGRLCTAIRRATKTCQEMRFLDKRTFLKRDSGEVVEYLDR